MVNPSLQSNVTGQTVAMSVVRFPGWTVAWPTYKVAAEMTTMCPHCDESVGGHVTSGTEHLQTEDT